MMTFDWHNEKRKIRDLVPYVANPRQITEKQAQDLKASLDKFGVADPIIINTDNTIIGGHQRKKILETLMGVDPDHEIDVRVPDRELSIDESRELNVRLNKNVAGWDFDTLANNFELDDLLDWGFEKSELDIDLWMDDPPEDAEPQIDRAEELREVWGVETGQLWQLGEHKLICGDCTVLETIEIVLDGKEPQLILTSPPYGVGMEYEGKPDEGKTVDLLFECFSLWCLFVRSGGFAFVNFGERYIWSMPMVQVYFDIFKSMNFRWYDQRFWKRSNVGMAIWNTTQPRAMSQVEYLFTFQKGEGAYPVHDLDISKEQLWVDEGSSAGISHPAVMAVGVAEKAIKIYSDVNDIIADPFLGSGTTLIACERLNRKCRAAEISPAYVAVAIQRWVDMTGGEPVLIREES